LQERPKLQYTLAIPEDFGYFFFHIGCRYGVSVYKAVPSRDRTVTETTRVLLALFRSHLVGCVVSVTLSRVVSVTSKTVTSLHALKMADSVTLDTAVDSVPNPIARQKMGAKGGHKTTL
jgi:hypothetical protein